MGVVFVIKIHSVFCDVGSNSLCCRSVEMQKVLTELQAISSQAAVSEDAPVMPKDHPPWASAQVH
jgi:hypothetical protein